MMMGAAISSSRNKKREVSAAPAPAAPTETPTADSGFDAEKLRQLAELKEQGILTQEEFDAKKKQLLGL
jgi:hypothetical protein